MPSVVSLKNFRGRGDVGRQLLPGARKPRAGHALLDGPSSRVESESAESESPDRRVLTLTAIGFFRLTFWEIKGFSTKPPKRTTFCRGVNSNQVTRCFVASNPVPWLVRSVQIGERWVSCI